MKNRIVFFLISIILMPCLCFGQNRKISGTITAFNKYPLKHLTVHARKAKTEAVTDENGNFEIEVARNDKIEIRDPVFEPYSRKVGKSDSVVNINVYIHNDEKSLQTVITKGYITREHLDYGAQHLWHENNVYHQFRTVWDAIKHAIPEATISQENGHMGVVLRGNSSITQSNQALIIVNGQVTDDPGYIQPDNIYRITRLSMSATALYGSRAANGVISIETR